MQAVNSSGADATPSIGSLTLPVSKTFKVANGYTITAYDATGDKSINLGDGQIITNGARTIFDTSANAEGSTILNFYNNTFSTPK